jgi:cytidylate kinase
MQTELNSVKSDIAKRDHQDTTRQFAPLKKADDAMEIDTTELDISQVLQKVYERLGI